MGSWQPYWSLDHTLSSIPLQYDCHRAEETCIVTSPLVILVHTRVENPRSGVNSHLTHSGPYVTSYHHSLNCTTKLSIMAFLLICKSCLNYTSNISMHISCPKNKQNKNQSAEPTRWMCSLLFPFSILTLSPKEGWLISCCLFIFLKCTCTLICNLNFSLLT
jgi:hypothetical protein